MLIINEMRNTSNHKFKDTGVMKKNQRNDDNLLSDDAKKIGSLVFFFRIALLEKNSLMKKCFINYLIIDG